MRVEFRNTDSEPLAEWVSTPQDPLYVPRRGDAVALYDTSRSQNAVFVVVDVIWVSQHEVMCYVGCRG